MNQKKMSAYMVHLGNQNFMIGLSIYLETERK